MVVERQVILTPSLALIQMAPTKALIRRYAVIVFILLNSKKMVVERHATLTP